jgi:hypothetical protein
MACLTMLIRHKNLGRGYIGTRTDTTQQSGQTPDKEVQGDQKGSVHLMITTQKVTSNVQSVPRQSPDIY